MTNTSINGIKNAKLKKLVKIMTLSVFLLMTGMTAASARDGDSQETLEPQQSKTRITGTVVDQTGEPVIGANVKEKGTTNGVITNESGRFTLTVTDNTVLQISYVGYVTQEVVTGNRTTLQITLHEDMQALDEVVVVGYGTQKKVNLTGSVVAVSGEDLAKRPVMSTTLALQGLASGVSISSTSGQPGNEGESVRVRGIGTLNNNDPLVLVDGVASSINAVNTYDIESISILKDAASSSIYGSRAANGVILITTKRAKDGKFAINFSGNLGWQQPTDMPTLLGAIDYMELYDLASSNDSRNMDTGAPGGVMYGTEYINNYRNNMASDPYRYPNTDWQAITYKTPAFQQQYNLSFSGGTDKLRAIASLSIQDQTGLLRDTGLKRYSLRVNTDYNFSEQFSAGIDILGRHSLVTQPTGGGVDNVGSLLGEIRRTASIYPYITPAGNPAFVQLGTNTWVNSQEKYVGYNRNYYQEAIINLKASWAPIKELRFDFAYAPKMNFSTNKRFKNIVETYNMDEEITYRWPQQRSIYMNKDYSLNQDSKVQANFDKSFGNHNLHVIGGFQQITNYWENVNAYREKSEFQYDQLAAFPVLNQTGNGNADEWALQSYYSRLNYDFAGKYLFEAVMRYDGSSRFAPGYKWGFFPSFSAGWRISEESFMKGIEWLSNAKIRGSYGQLGNQEGLGNYPFSMDINLNVPVVFNRVVADGYAATTYAMKDITWETTTMTDIGLDLGFLNKWEVVFDYYVKTTDNILMNMDIPAVMGYSNSPRQNAGKVENKGWDLSVSYRNRQGDFTYSATATLSDVHNRILDMKGIVSNFDVRTNREGYPINSLYGLQDDGLFATFEDAKAWTVAQYGRLQGGDVKYVDQLTLDSDGDGIPDTADGLINGDDRIIIGNTIPRYIYSLDLSVSYKDFDLGLFFQGVGKRDSYLNQDLAWAFNNAGNVQQWQKDNMWTEGKTDSKYPRMFIASSNNTQNSTYWKQ
ncbi:MAG: TonB-dependent receptor, partial [Tannerella sp.]|nr:TonB-dependent receptor [Tannerella sp.]